MKKIITTILLLLFCFSAYTQIEKYVIKAENLTDPDLKILYIGMDNILSIENNLDKNIFLNIKNGVLTKYTKNENCDYYIARVSGGNHATIRILKKINNDSIILDTIDFKVMKIPNPKAVFGNLIDTVATVDALLLQNEIKVYIPTFFRLYLNVTNFTFSVSRNDMLIVSEEAYGNIITKHQKDIIRRLRAGDILWIEDIKARGKYSCSRALPSIKISVTAR